MSRRRLILMRHASAGGAPTGASDHARRLTPEGQHEAQRMGSRLAELGCVPDRVLCSTATRCRETWEGLRRAMRTEAAVDFEDALYNASPEGLLNALAGVIEGETLLLLAHNPGVSLLAFELARGREGPDDGMRRGFSPATLAIFEIETGWGEVSSTAARLQSIERPVAS